MIWNTFFKREIIDSKVRRNNTNARAVISLYETMISFSNCQESGAKRWYRYRVCVFVIVLKITQSLDVTSRRCFITNCLSLPMFPYDCPIREIKKNELWKFEIEYCLRLQAAILQLCI